MSTAEDITETVRNKLGSISRQAVYDTLGVFVESTSCVGYRCRFGLARYEDRVGDNHHHLVCRGCDLMYDIDCAVGATPCLTADDDHGFLLDEAEVVHWGWCPACQT